MLKANIGMSEILGTLFIIIGLVTMTVGIVGMLRGPDVYVKMQAASKAVVLGVAALCVGLFFTFEGAIQARVALIALFIVLTAPVSGHVIIQAARRSRVPMESPHAIDESRPEFWS
jgi:multicomponent Na+:H+ antiporter subunit G